MSTFVLCPLWSPIHPPRFQSIWPPSANCQAARQMAAITVTMYRGRYRPRGPQPLAARNEATNPWSLYGGLE